MTTKVISTRDFADIKRMAQIVNPKVSRKTTLLKQKEKIDAELEELDEAISLLEGGIKCKFLGLGTEQLVKKVVAPAFKEDDTPALDAKTGKQLTKTTWEPLECLVHNEEKNNYTLTVEDGSANPDGDAIKEGSVCGTEAQEAMSQGEPEGSDNPFGM